MDIRPEKDIEILVLIQLSYVVQVNTKLLSGQIPSDAIYRLLIKDDESDFVMN